MKNERACCRCLGSQRPAKMSEWMPWRDYYLFLLLLLYGSYASNSCAAFQVKRPNFFHAADAGPPRQTVEAHQVAQQAQVQQPHTIPSVHLDKKQSTVRLVRGSKPCRLKLLSREPYLWVSQDPLLSQGECEMLSQYHASSQTTPDEHEEAQRILSCLRKRLDFLLGGQIEKDSAMEPRFLHYDSIKPAVNTNISSPVKMLLPDGLHVDTNNGYLFRYLTVLVYLTTTSKTGATSFPLARPLSSTSESETSIPQQQQILLEAAQMLLNGNIRHTKAQTKSADNSATDPTVEHRLRLEKAAYDLYRRQQQPYDSAFTVTTTRQSTLTTTASSSLHGPGDGIRVLPRAGHCTIFSSIDSATGQTDPRSWHGAEALIDTSSTDCPNNNNAESDCKQVLTFFLEIPVASFDSQMAFGRQAALRYRRISEASMQESAIATTRSEPRRMRQQSKTGKNKLT